MYSDRYNPVCVSEAKGLTNYTLNVVDDIENNIANVKKIMSNCGVSGEGITASLSKIENSIERIRNIPDFIEKSEMAIFKQLIKSSQWSVNLTQWLNSGDISSNELVNMASMYLNAFIEIYGNDYYKQLKEINQPLSALIEKGLPSNVANNLNQSFLEMLIEKNMMYTGEGVAYMADSFIGLLAMFGLSMDYKFGGSFDGESEFYLGDSEKGLSRLDCNNFFDWLCRCVGIDSWAYAATKKNIYGKDAFTSIDEILADSSKSYYTNGKAGDILSRGDSSQRTGHIVVILSNDGKGYWIAEESGCAKKQYLTYEEAKKSGYLITNMSALYRNTSKSPEKARYGKNNFIPPSAYSNLYPGLSADNIALLNNQFNMRNLYGKDEATVLAFINGEMTITSPVHIPNIYSNNNLEEIVSNMGVDDIDRLWDNSMTISVNGQGTYPIDEYVAGVILGESQIRSYCESYFRGECTLEQVYEATKSFAVIARSFGIHQAVESGKNTIGNGTSAQCFNEARLHADENQFKGVSQERKELFAKLAKLAAYETSGQVITLDVNSNDVAPGYYGSKMANSFIDEAKNGSNYIEILNKNYTPDYSKHPSTAKSDYGDGTERPSIVVDYDYATRTFTGISENSGTVHINMPNSTGSDNISEVQQLDNLDNEKVTNTEQVNVNNNNKTHTSNYTNTEINNNISQNISDNSNAIPKVNILPENKFSEILPSLSDGILNTMEISNEHVQYQISNIDDTSYNAYINKLEEAGFTLSGNNEWVKDGYKIVAVKDNSNILTLSVYKEISSSAETPITI